MKKTLILILLFPQFLCFAQKGPGGVGNNDGATALKIWYRADFGVSLSSSLINSVTNAAGISALNISETGTQRPTLAAATLNGYNEMRFSGSNRLETGPNLTTSNFVSDQASSFVVCKADNTTQQSSIYLTNPLVTNRFTSHIPWITVLGVPTVFFDMGDCCGSAARVESTSPTLVASFTNHNVWSYTANTILAKQIFRNGSMLVSTSGISNFTAHSGTRFNIGGNVPTSGGYVGSIAEVIIFNTRVNVAQRIIIENYLAAKYGITTSFNNVYQQDEPANGNYDHDVAGIGQIDASNIQNDSQGTGIVRILNPSNLGNTEFLMWGHNKGDIAAIERIDVPAGVQARMRRVWRASEVSVSALGAIAAADVGSINIRFDLTGLGPVTASDLRLLVDTDNDNVFSDETPISGATLVSGKTYQFSGVTAITNGRRFTLATINKSQTPIPVKLLSFNASLQNNQTVKLNWETVTEIDNKHFMVEKSENGNAWTSIATIQGAGNSTNLINYQFIDTNPFEGTTYYRLKQTDFNATVSYSSIVTVFLQKKNTKVSLVPNPATNNIKIEANNGTLIVQQVYNSIGQDVTQRVKINNLNTKTVNMNVYALAQGYYWVRTNVGFYQFYKK